MSAAVMQATALRPSSAHLNLPFFEAAHRHIAAELPTWANDQRIDESDDRRACRDWVTRMGQAGWLRYCVPGEHGGALPALDSRALVLLRETLAFYSPLADFSFAMQGLGSGAISIGGTPEQQQAYLPHVAAGTKIAAFALSEPEAGSDVAAMQLQAQAQADGSYRLNGSKTWISNGGMADFYCVFAKTDPQGGSRGISAFIVDGDNPGLDSSRHIQVMAPHPLSELHFSDCAISAQRQLGTVNAGFKLAMQTLDIFRASVAGAALGMARRALAEAMAHASQRKMFGQTLADFQLTEAKLGEMAALIDAGALLTYRAAWMRDTNQGSRQERTVAAAMAKMTATENAQRVIDMALQMHGGLGVMVGSKVESLYRDIRALRIYEGATEVQQFIIGKALLQDYKEQAAS